MRDLTDVYLKLQEKKKERREIAKMFKDELDHDAEYQQIVEDMKRLREKKRSIETAAKARALADAERLDVLKVEIDGENEMLADIALTRYAANEQVEIVDDSGQRWVPQFRVSFKKGGEATEAERAAAERAVSHPERTFVPQADEAHDEVLQPA